MKIGVENVEIGSDQILDVSGKCSLCQLELLSEDETHWIKSSIGESTRYHSICFYHVAWAIQKFLTEFGITVAEGGSRGNYN